MLCCAWSLSCVQLFATLWTVACQASLSVGIFQARILEWVAMPSSRGSSRPRDRTQVSCIAGGFFTSWATREALMMKWWNIILEVVVRAKAEQGSDEILESWLCHFLALGPWNIHLSELKLTEVGIKGGMGTFLVIQWLRICLAKQGTWVWSLLEELRSHMPRNN